MASTDRPALDLVADAVPVHHPADVDRQHEPTDANRFARLDLGRHKLTTPSCPAIAAVTIDDAVAGVLLDALTAEQVALALDAADQVAGRHQRAAPPAGRRARTL